MPVPFLWQRLESRREAGFFFFRAVFPPATNLTTSERSDTVNGKSDTKRGNMGSKFTAGALLIAMTLTLTLACSGSNSKPEADPTQQEMLDTIDRMEQEIVALREEVEGQGELELPIYLFQGQKILGGDIVNIESLTGEKPVVVNFWSAESPPSIHNLTEIQDFHKKYGDQVLVLGVDVRQATGQGTHKEGLDLLTELGITFFAGYVKDDRILTEYGIKGLPTTIFINTDGSVNDKWTGTLNQDVLVEKAGGMLLEGSLLAKAQATEPPGPCANSSETRWYSRGALPPLDGCRRSSGRFKIRGTSAGPRLGIPWSMTATGSGAGDAGHRKARQNVRTVPRWETWMFLAACSKDATLPVG